MTDKTDPREGASDIGAAFDPPAVPTRRRNKPGAGRPPLGRDDKTAKQVQAMTGYGLSEWEIAKVVGMSAPTLRKYYAPELENGHLIANAKVAESLFKMATHPTKPHVAAAIFWCKARMRWKDRPELDGGELGKKEAAEILGKVAEKGSDWEGLLS